MGVGGVEEGREKKEKYAKKESLRKNRNFFQFFKISNFSLFFFSPLLSLSLHITLYRLTLPKLRGKEVSGELTMCKGKALNQFELKEHRAIYGNSKDYKAS